MIQLHPNLFVGDQIDYERICDENDVAGWAFLHACKEPYHRSFVGYVTRGAPKDDPEYLVARRDNELALNMVDVDDPQYIRPELFAVGLAFIDEHLDAGRRVLVHCNQGMSRGPSIAMAWMNDKGLLPDTFEAAETAFRGMYPAYAPKNGVRVFLEANW